MLVKTYKCDMCGREKGIENHWWSAQNHRYEAVSGEHFLEFSVRPFHQTHDDDWIHLCGDQCLYKKFSEFLQAK